MWSFQVKVTHVWGNQTMRLTAKGVREEGDCVWPKGVLVFNAGEVQEREDNRTMLRQTPRGTL
jgi:hypothetical protein